MTKISKKITQWLLAIVLAVCVCLGVALKPQASVASAATKSAYPYTVTFVNWDDSVIAEVGVGEDEAATAPANPTRADDDQYTYEFSHWIVVYYEMDGEGEEVPEDENLIWEAEELLNFTLTVKAVYTATEKKVETEDLYTVTFVDWDNSEIAVVGVGEDEAATAPANPTRAEDDQYTYEFSHWIVVYYEMDGEGEEIPESDNFTWDPEELLNFTLIVKAVYTATEKTVEPETPVEPEDPDYVEVQFTALIEREYNEQYGLSVRFDTVGLTWESYHNFVNASDWASIADYTLVNGKSVTEINAETSSAQKITLMMQPAGTFSFLRLYIPETVMPLSDIASLAIVGGWTYDNGTTVYKDSDTTYFYNRNNGQIDTITKLADASNVTITEAVVDGEASELYKVTISNSDFISTCDPYDYNYIGGVALRQSILINGRSVQDINMYEDDSAYTYVTFPMTNAATYTYNGQVCDTFSNPVVLYAEKNTGTLTLYIHKNYVESLGEGTEVVITLSKALVFANAALVGEVSKSVMTVGESSEDPDTPDVPDVPVTPPATGETIISSASVGGDAGEIYVVEIKNSSWNSTCNIYDYNYGGIYVVFRQSILINGKSIHEINTTTDDSAYGYITYPMNLDNTYQHEGQTYDLFRNPIVVSAKDDTITLWIHREYIASLGNGTEVVVTVVDGFTHTGVALTEEASAVVMVVEATEIPEDPEVVFDHAKVGGEKGELYTVDITCSAWNSERDPFDFNYGGDFVLYRQKILINGVSVQEINMTTDDSAYNYVSNPMTNNATYTYNGNTYDNFSNPVLIHAKGDTITLWIHKNYIESLGNGTEVVVTLIAGFNHSGVILLNEVSGVAMTVGEVIDPEDPDTPDTPDVPDVPVDPEEPEDPEYVEVEFTALIERENSEQYGLSVRFDTVGLTWESYHNFVNASDWASIADYTLINGKSVTEINATTSSAQKITLMMQPAGTFSFLRLYIPETVMSLSDIASLAIVSGWEYDNGTAIYKDSDTTYFYNKNNGQIIPVTKFTDASNVTITKAVVDGEASELYKVTISGSDFKSTCDPYDYNYVIGVALRQSILINGRSVQDINMHEDDSAYNYVTSPMTNNATYAYNGGTYDLFSNPVLLYAEKDTGTLTLYIHKNYVESLGEGTEVVITLSNALIFADVALLGEVSKSVMTVGESSTPEVPQTVIGGAYVGGEAGELYVVDITNSNWNSKCDPYDYNYGGAVALRQGILINGKSIHEINTMTDDSAYTYMSYPQTQEGTFEFEGASYDLFRNPILIYAEGNMIRLWMHKDYIESLGEGTEVVITLVEGFTFTDVVLAEEVSSVVMTVGGNDTPDNPDTPDVPVTPPIDPDAKVVISEAVTSGDAGELYVVTIQNTNWNSERDPFDYNYAFAVALRQNILINGKSIHEINTTTDDSAYIYISYPQSLEGTFEFEGNTYDLFKNPILIYARGNTITLWIHKDYIASLGVNVPVNVTLLAGMEFTGVVLEEEVTSAIIRTMITVTVNGEEVKVPYGLPMEEPAVPVKEGTETTKFVFVGWYVEGADEAFDFATVITESIVLVPMFEEQDRAQYSVVFGSAAPVTAYEGLKLTAPADPTKEPTVEEEFMFVGWFVDGDASKMWNFETDVLEGDLTLIPLFNNVPRKYTVSFGEYANEKTVRYGNTVSQPATTPKKDATESTTYKFIGWYNGDTKWNFATDVVEGDMTLLPRFEEITRTYTVSFGEYADEQVVEFGECAEEPDAPEVDGKEFIGWFYDDEEWDFDTEITEDIELEARFEDVEEDEEDNYEDEEEDEEDEDEDNNNNNNNNAQTGFGCYASIGGSIAVLLLPVAAALALKKRKED